MAIHSAGPRLFGSIPFRYIAANRKGGKMGGGAVNVALNVTPFVDMMTILVTFLLMVFSAEGTLMSVQPRLTLPDATSRKDLKRAPIIIISQDEVSFNGEPAVARVEDLASDESIEWKIVELHERLVQEMQQFRLRGKKALSDDEKRYCAEGYVAKNPKQYCLEGLVILQADKGTKTKVLNRVVKTAYAAEYFNILFAVNRRGSRE